MPFMNIDFNFVECQNCGLIYINPRLLEEDLMREEYDKIAQNHYGNPIYIPQFSASEYKKLFEEDLHAFEKYRHNNRLLDVGCANGAFLDMAREKYWNVFGVEISKYSASYAIQNLKLNIYIGKLPEAHFIPGFFDVITMWEVIEHLNDPLGYLLEANRILRRGGLIAISTPNINSISYNLLKDKWSGVVGPPGHMYYFSPKTIKRLLEKTNFKIKKVTSRGIDVRKIANLLNPNLPFTRIESMFIYIYTKVFTKMDRLIVYAQKE
jgi:2-polyprenyl-3-methyl-5-hydroxy-6-metoxy-1,4-benzoquinol methylase